MRDIRRGVWLEQLGQDMRYPSRLVRRYPGFSAVAVMSLALVGLYALISCSVARRTSELGLRMALGADRRDLLTMVLGQGAGLAGAGVLVGGVVSMLLPVLTASVVGLGDTPIGWLLAVPVLLAAAALAATFVPACRAARTDPTVALRTE